MKWGRLGPGSRRSCLLALLCLTPLVVFGSPSSVCSGLQGGSHSIPFLTNLTLKNPDLNLQR